MKVDMQPCPVCEAMPPLQPTEGGVTLRQEGHKPEAEEVDVSTQEKKDAWVFLFFRCQRCGARWPEQPERVVRA